MLRAPDVDGMIVGEPEDGVVALATRADLTDARRHPEPDVPARRRTIVPHTAQGTFAGFLTMPFPAWDLLPLEHYTLPLEGKPYVLVETSRGCPYTCDFCVAPIHQGHKFRERDAKAIVDEMEAGQAHARRDALLPLGRHGHAQREDVLALLRRARSRATSASAGSATPAPTTS